jgi:hypothetical protein
MEMANARANANTPYHGAAPRPFDHGPGQAAAGLSFLADQQFAFFTGRWVDVNETWDHAIYTCRRIRGFRRFFGRSQSSQGATDPPIPPPAWSPLQRRLFISHHEADQPFPPRGRFLGLDEALSVNARTAVERIGIREDTPAHHAAKRRNPFCQFVTVIRSFGGRSSLEYPDRRRCTTARIEDY